MPRYLAPSKIGLIVLTRIYLDSQVSAAATIPILSFLIELISASAHIDSGPGPGIDQFKARLEPHAASIPGRTLWDSFVQCLWSIPNLDALHMLLDSSIRLVQKSREHLLYDENRSDDEDSEDEDGEPETKLSRYSPLGIFIRRVYLEFTRLQLHDGIRLWEDFVVFREPSHAEWKKRAPVSTFISSYKGSDIELEPLVSSALNEHVYGALMGEEGARRGSASIDDLDRLLVAQVEYTQKTCLRMPEDVRARLHDMLHGTASASSLPHYNAYFDAWRAGDYTSAFDNLHRYYDYTMHVSGRDYYHFALLNMAFLHADFGCSAEAIAAVKESIAMAREKRDMACLNYSMSWLYNYGKQHPEEILDIQNTGVLGHTDREALHFIKAKAKDTKSWSLLAMCMLTEASLVLANGESLAAAFENIYKASYLINTKGLAVTKGQQMKTESTLYARLGVYQMEWSSTDLFLDTYAKEAPAQDQLEFTCRRAAQLARGGRFDAAIAAMCTVGPEVLRVLNLKQVWTLTVILLKLRRALLKSDFCAARHYLSRAKAVSTTSYSDTVSFDLSLCEIDYDMRTADYAGALALIESLLSTQPATADIRNKLHLLLLKAATFDKAGVPQKGFSIAVRAANAAYKARIYDVLYRAIGVLARVLLSLREFVAAQQLVVSIMPMAIECEDRGLAGSLFLVLADTCMGMAGTTSHASHASDASNSRPSTPGTAAHAHPSSPPTSPAVASPLNNRKEHITQSLEYLARAFDEYSSIEDVQGQCKVLAKRAMIMRVTGDLVLANDCAAKYLNIRRAAAAEAALAGQGER